MNRKSIQCRPSCVPPAKIAERERIGARSFVTPRENAGAQVLSHQARASKEIAPNLGISHGTVEVYRGRLNEKVGAKSSVEVVRPVAGVA